MIKLNTLFSPQSKQAKFIFSLFALWLLIVFLAPMPLIDLIKYGQFLFLGTLGAIFANSTGAGGGVVFIPAFNQFGFTEAESIATSFAIQCFGMTAGAVTWYRYYLLQQRNTLNWQHFNTLILLCSVFSVCGLWLVYGVHLSAPTSLHLSFSGFSTFLGASIFASVYFLKPGKVHSQLCHIDWGVLASISLLGGIITAWLSVGVGELVAIYLIIRRFDLVFSIATAVVISAITVWAGIWQHLLIDFQVYWQVVIFAGPGAVIGGVLAKVLVNKMSVIKLKLFFAFWLFVIGIVGIFIPGA